MHGGASSAPRSPFSHVPGLNHLGARAQTPPHPASPAAALMPMLCTTTHASKPVSNITPPLKALARPPRRINCSLACSHSSSYIPRSQRLSAWSMYSCSEPSLSPLSSQDFQAEKHAVVTPASILAHRPAPGRSRCPGDNNDNRNGGSGGMAVLGRVLFKPVCQILQVSGQPWEGGT